METRSASLRSRPGGGSQERASRTLKGAEAPGPGTPRGVENWGTRHGTEPAAQYAERIKTYGKEYEQTGGAVKRVQQELAGALNVMARAPVGKKEQLLVEAGRLQSQVKALHARRALILENAGPFRERLLNQERFDSLRSQGSPGLRSPADQEAGPGEGGVRAAGGSEAAAAEKHAQPGMERETEPRKASGRKEAAATVTPAGGASAAAAPKDRAEREAAMAAGAALSAPSGGKPSGAKPSGAKLESTAGCTVPQGAGSTAPESGQEDGERMDMTQDSTQDGAQEVVSGECGVPAGQGRRESYGSSLTSSGDESGGGSGGSGGRMVMEIRRMESPLHAGFLFSGDLPPEEVPGGRKQKKKKRKKKGEYVGKFVYGAPEAVSVPCSPSPSLVAPTPSPSGPTPSPSAPIPSPSVPQATNPTSYISAPTFTFSKPPGSPAPSPMPPSHPSQPPLLHTTPSNTPPLPSSSQPKVPPTPAEVSVIKEKCGEKLLPGPGATGAPTVGGEVGPGAPVAAKSVDKGKKVSGGVGRGDRHFYSDVEDAEVAEGAGRRSSWPPQVSRPLPPPTRGSPVGPAALVQVGGSTGTHRGGPSAPPPVQVRSYASVVKTGGISVSGAPGSGYLQQQILGALTRGEDAVTIEGEVTRIGAPRSQYRPRDRRGGDFWSSPTGPVGRRRNVVRLQWSSSDPVPPRSRVVELLLDMGFRAGDIFALIHPFNTRDFDVSFVRPEGLDLFWLNFEQARRRPDWSGFSAIPISCQNDVKTVNVLTRNESLSCVDITTWLKRYGDIQGLPRKDLDEYGIWSGAWTFSVKLRRSGPTLCHIPSSAFLGRDRILVFYQGQPRVCHRCGDPAHFSANCTKEVCVKCGGVGHTGHTCGVLRCHLCGGIGHPFSKCPRSSANADPMEALWGQLPVVSEGGGAGGSVRETTVVEETPSQEREPERAGPSTDPVAETPGEGELEEEIRRLDRESGTGRQTPGPRKGKLPNERGGKKKSVPPSDQVAKGAQVASPLTALSNRFLPLEDKPTISGNGDGEGGEPGSSEGPVGDAGPPPSGAIAPPGGGIDPGPPDKELRQGEGVPKECMDTSVCLKRVKEGCSSAQGDEGSVKKRAVLNHS